MQYWLMIAFVCLLLQADGCFASSLKAQLSVAPKAEGLMEFDSIIQVFQTLSRKPTCHQSVIYSLMAQCELQNSVLSMDERIQFSTRLTMCDLEHADITVPSECLRGSQQKCLATLEDNSAWWLAFVSYYRDMDRLCKSAFLEYEKQNALELNKNITRIQKRLLEVLQEKLTEQEISLELMQDTTATSIKRLEQIITTSQSSVIMDMEQQTAQLQKLQNSFDLLTQYQSEVLDSEAFASNKLELLRENVNGLLSAYSSQMNALANIANRGLQSLADEVSKHQTNLQESAVQDAKTFANEVVHTYRNSMAQTKNDLMNFMKSQQSLTEFYLEPLVEWSEKLMNDVQAADDWILSTRKSENEMLFRVKEELQELLVKQNTTIDWVFSAIRTMRQIFYSISNMFTRYLPTLVLCAIFILFNLFKKAFSVARRHWCLTLIFMSVCTYATLHSLPQPLIYCFTLLGNRLTKAVRPIRRFLTQKQLLLISLIAISFGLSIIIAGLICSRRKTTAREQNILMLTEKPSTPVEPIPSTCYTNGSYTTIPSTNAILMPEKNEQLKKLDSASWWEM